MSAMSIGERLFLKDDPRGATLVCRTGEGQEAIVFQVGMSTHSLIGLNQQLSQMACLWNIADGSLSIYGDSEELTLTFCSCRGPFVEVSVSLIGDDLKAFKWAVHAFASRHTARLN